MRMYSERMQRLLPVLLLLLAALIYYSLYYRSGFEIADEGSVALLSQRLLEGERPFIDVSLHYNLLWFYPITGLFALTGPDFVVMRIYFFALAAVTAVIGYFTVLRVSGSRWYSFAAALLLVLLPGSPYKTYIPLIIVANMYFMVRLVMEKELSRYALTSALGGVVLGLGYLIRIDIAMLLSVVWIAVFVLHAALRWRDLSAAVKRAAVGFAACAIAVIIVHLPVHGVAGARGFEQPFLGQYRGMRGMLVRPVLQFFGWGEARDRIQRVQKPEVRSDAKPRQAIVQLGRPSPKAIFAGDKFRDRVFAFLTYAPIAGVALFLCGGCAMPRSDLQRRVELSIALASAPLAAFPQFFLFRPDTPHLAEFMPGYIVAIGAGAYLFARSGPRWLGLPVAVFLGVHLCTYALFALQTPFSGTIIARKKRTTLFEAENGVSVYLTKKEVLAFSKLVEVIHDYSRPGEYVVCYPYFPGINFMANRPTYEKSLYIDNVIRPRHWYEETVEEIETHQPAVIILRDWEIQGPGSAFSVWAADVKQYIKSRYYHQGTYWHFEVYTRRRVPLGGAQAARSTSSYSVAIMPRSNAHALR